MKELDKNIHDHVTILCEEGDELAEQEDLKGALAKYWEAFDHLPEPQTLWEATTWVLTAIGDANFSGGDYKAGVDNLSYAMHCPKAIGNPFIHLRLGQCQLEQGNEKRAAEELTRAYAIAGSEIFEDDDPKYFEFLKSKIDM
ncbi:tetratricopeptide repeat protein [Fulvivirga sediminis]|uniref:Tetratricopeptide repeat protein n=1 Tax=Fulvivirga sediminis TaxID=2803949 RepID=A0A937F713_9BACT|nr:hypothetical protein [Fulvivirga sediminis]MBL3655158.1 hypothetical protein [Fulvivirga sediminis]